MYRVPQFEYVNTGLKKLKSSESLAESRSQAPATPRVRLSSRAESETGFKLHWQAQVESTATGTVTLLRVYMPDTGTATGSASVA